VPSPLAQTTATLRATRSSLLPLSFPLPSFSPPFSLFRPGAIKENRRYGNNPSPFVGLAKNPEGSLEFSQNGAYPFFPSFFFSPFFFPPRFNLISDRGETRRPSIGGSSQPAISNPLDRQWPWLALLFPPLPFFPPFSLSSFPSTAARIPMKQNGGSRRKCSTVAGRSDAGNCSIAALPSLSFPPPSFFFFFLSFLLGGRLSIAGVPNGRRQ